MKTWSLLVLIGVLGCGMQTGKPRGGSEDIDRPLAAMAPEPARAEFAVRWDVSAGGPKTAEEVLAALQLEPKKDKETGKPKEKKVSVQYFDVGKPEAPTGFKAILRRRTDKKKSELTFKLRGGKAIVPPSCPLGAAETKDPEVDVTFTGESQTSNPAYSYSCEKETAPSEEPPQDLMAKAVGCLASMRRLEAKFAADELKVEEWQVAKVRYVEVSFSGRNDAPDREAFGKKVVAVLLKKGIHPLENGMTTITTSCSQPNK